jgi:putative IMPACT (imprinted ancient) family translation regulator
VDQSIFRSNDDGEPTNSAGAPILGQIQSFDLSNVLIGVVRYFGGTKLGVGGLIQAYRTAAKQAILEGEVIELEVFEWLKLSFDYAEMPSVMHLIKQYHLSIKDPIFENDCLLITNLPLHNNEFLKEEFAKIENLTFEILGIY